MSKVYTEECLCKDCTKREVGCHGKCEEYSRWQKSGIEIKQELFAPIIDFSKKKRRG